MVILIDSYTDTEYEEKFFLSIVRTISKFVDFSDDSELSLLITDDGRIQELNHTYRNKNRPTDVLSFPMEDEYMLGDIVISLDTAKRQAAEADIPLSREVAFLFIHGFLHLMGFDHEDQNGNESDEAEEMYTLQEEILADWEKSFEQ